MYYFMVSQYMKFRRIFRVIPIAIVFSMLLIVGSSLSIVAYGLTINTPNLTKMTPSANLTDFVNENENENGSNTKCNCVVFRIDGIQDTWINNGQLTPMDIVHFKKSKSLSWIDNELCR